MQPNRAPPCGVFALPPNAPANWRWGAASLTLCVFCIAGRVNTDGPDDVPSLARRLGPISEEVEEEMGWLWILLVVLLIVALLGGFGYSRRW